MFRTYLLSIILILAILFGGAVGYYGGASVHWLKPWGDVFLNLIFTTIVPLIFFSVSSAVARAASIHRLRQVFSAMSGIFIFTSALAAALAIAVVMLFPPAKDVVLTLNTIQNPISSSVLNQIASIFTVSDFSKLLSHEHMLALIVFSLLVGFAASKTHQDNTGFIAFLSAGERVFMRVFSLIMWYAPIGFFAYFAVLVSELGPALIESYARVSVIYYIFALFYFICIYTIYAYIAGKKQGLRLFWKNVFLPASTSIATCSSAASIPATLIATKAMHVSTEIAETMIPLGCIIHKEGSVIGGVFKIAFLFGIFHLKFSGLSILLTALGVSMLVGTVMGAIPSGGMLGELLILTAYGFPSSTLMIISAISIIIDPIATLLNVTGNSVSAMLVARWVDGKTWLINKK